jgi:hypothetical protein
VVAGSTPVPYNRLGTTTMGHIKALLLGQKDHIFFSGHLIYILKQECFRALRPARDL